jgi:hypothetical protein
MAQLLMTEPRTVGADVVGAPSPVQVMPSRRTLNNRFPTLCFFVETGALNFFEILLTSDCRLFDAENAGERVSGNFYSSREDAGLLEAENGRGIYHVPPVVLKNFAQQMPKPEQLFFVAIAYATSNGAGPHFSHPQETLSSMAPSIIISRDFTGATLSHVLGTVAERMRTVGPFGKIEVSPKSPAVPGPGGLPLKPPASGETPSPAPIDPIGTTAPPADDAEKGPTPSYPDEGEDGVDVDREQEQLRADGNGKTSGSIPQNGGNGDSGPGGVNRGVPTDPALPAWDDIEYDDGFGPPHEATETEENKRPPTHGIGEYGDDDYGIPPSGNGPTPSTTHGGYGAPGAGNGGSAVDHPLKTDLRDLDPMEGIVVQSLDHPFEQLGGVSADGVGITAQVILSDEAKRRIVQYVAEADHGQARYSAMNLDGEFKGRAGRESLYFHRAHRGLSYGIAQFNQDSGDLGRLLTLMHDRDAALFQEVFGPNWRALLNTTTSAGPGSLDVEGGRSSRVQPVGNADLWEEPWVARFRRASDQPTFQAAQNQLAARLFLDPVMVYASRLGLYTERGLVMLYDIALQAGLNEALIFVVNAIGPIKTEAQRASCLKALLDQSEEPTLEEFQRNTELPPSGDWTYDTHAAMVGALRELHQRGAEIPIELPAYDEMLDALVIASARRKWAQRVERLRAATELSDQPYTS